MAERRLAIRFFDVNPGDALICESLDAARSHELKLRALEHLSIQPRDGETPLQAWLRTMSEENNVPYTQPVAREIADAILESRAALRFVWFLSGGRP